MSCGRVTQSGAKEKNDREAVDGGFRSTPPDWKV